jgi:hypothetical protein
MLWNLCGERVERSPKGQSKRNGSFVEWRLADSWDFPMKSGRNLD